MSSGDTGNLCIVVGQDTTLPVPNYFKFGVMTTTCMHHSNSNSIFIALNLHLKTDPRHNKLKKQRTIIISLGHIKGRCHGEKLGKELN